MQLKSLKHIVLSGLALLSPWMAMAQGWVQNGAQVVVNQGAYVVINGTKGNLFAQGTSKFIIKGAAYLHIAGNVTNNTSGGFFTTNNGEIVLNGTTQQLLGGNSITAFPSLYIKSSTNPKLTYTILVGGGFNKGGNGVLALNDKQLLLNSQKLIINNRSEMAITYTTGGLVSETYSTAGYGVVQWNIRAAGAGPLYSIPFQTVAGTNVPFNLNIKNIGTQVSDSGFVTVATYPTPTTALPNNRPMPFGVPHLKNEYGIENARRMLDRFWVITDGGYTTAPEISTEFNYLDPEHSSGTNTIKESNMGAIRWDVANNKWSYPVRSRVNANQNNLLLHAGVNFSGTWTLSDITPCPTANFSFTGNCEKDSVLFIDKSSVVDDTLIRWQWNFANGNSASGDTAVGYFSPSGLYKPLLIVTAASGCSDTIYKQVSILGAPQANFVLEDTCENTVVKFKSLTSPGSGFIASEYWWFGDGKTTTGKSPLHYYGSSGNPTVQYIVYNTNLCKDTVIKTLYIAPKPYANFMVSPDCEDLTFPFTNFSTPGTGTITSYNWDFGNGRRSGQRNENVTYFDSGTFPVRLIVTNSYDCKDTSNFNLRVFPRAIANFDYSPNFPEMTNPVSFTNLSGISNKWDWDFGPQNTEGLNDKFGLETPLVVSQFNMNIYNRWGQIIFNSQDQFQKWDGRVNGKLVPIDVYIYDVTFKTPEMEIMHYKGDILMLR